MRVVFEDLSYMGQQSFEVYVVDENLDLIVDTDEVFYSFDSAIVYFNRLVALYLGV